MILLITSLRLGLIKVVYRYSTGTLNFSRKILIYVLRKILKLLNYILNIYILSNF